MKKENFQSHEVKENAMSEYTEHEAQIKVFREYLSYNTATCTMAARATGIPQKCLTRHKRELEKRGKLVEVFKGNCKITGFRAAYLSTNPDLIYTLNIYL